MRQGLAVLSWKDEKKWPKNSLNFLNLKFEICSGHHVLTDLFTKQDSYIFSWHVLTCRFNNSIKTLKVV